MNIDAISSSLSPNTLQQLGPLSGQLEGLRGQLPGAFASGQSPAANNASAPWNTFLQQAQSVEGMRDSLQGLTSHIPYGPTGEIAGPSSLPNLSGVSSAEGPSFRDTLGKLIEGVDAKQDVARAEVASLLRGESNSLHRVMIAREESSLAFTLMVEVRNKLVEGFQELMRMPL